MNAHINYLARFADLQNIIEEHEALAQRGIDWNGSYAATASNRMIVHGFAKDLATQFAETLTTHCEAACDNSDPSAAERLASIIHDWITDEFHDEWERVAAEAKTESSRHGRARNAADRIIADRRAA